jgi:hypothetical protein
MATVQSVLAFTVTLNVQRVVFPQASLAVVVTVVVPTGNTEPEAGLETRDTSPGQLSVAVTLKLTTAPLVLVAAREISAGHRMDGGIGS